MEGGIHIALKAEQIASLWGFPVTNTMLMSWIAMLVILGIALLVGKNLQKIPSKVQTFFETVFSFLLDYIEEVLESRELAKRFFPLIATLFFFILVGNWFALVPGIGSVFISEPLQVGAHASVDTHEETSEVDDSEAGVTHEAVAEGAETKTDDAHGSTEAHATKIAVFHPISVDLNVTLALAIIAFVSIEVAGVLYIGLFHYIGKFLNFSSPINFLVGIIEFISELARLVSFSFRLFGNMFAGKTLILVAMFFVPYIAPVPLMMYEVFVGLIQASIFSLLTLFFIKLAISEAH
jgi:F-type H+-transporting ATPase subunit a